MSKSYRRLRREAYPDVGEQLDALWTAIEALRGKTQLPAEAEAVRAKIAAVKAANPKPDRDGAA